MTMQTLANAELAVMDLLWRAQPTKSMTAREIREQLYGESDKAQHGTVQRLLQRLEDKDYIRRDRDQPVHEFHACITKEAYTCGQMETLAEKLTGGSIAPLITNLVDQKRISQDEIDRIRAILDEVEVEEGGA